MMITTPSRWALVPLLVSAWLAAPPGAAALTVQQAILRAKPAVVLIRSEISADVTLNCGTGPVTVQPTPFVETGTGWFVDGRGYVITNAHVVDPAYRLSAWVVHELKKKAIDDACVAPALRDRGLMPAENPDLEDRIRRSATERGLAGAKVKLSPRIVVLLSNNQTLEAEVKKFSPPPSFDASGQPTKDFGRDLALLRVKEGVYPALAPSSRDVNVGDPLHILGYPAVVLRHELVKWTATPQASATNGAVSGFPKDAIGQELIQTDAPAAHGNSGGPAIGADASVVGVLMAVTLSTSGAIVQGFNFLIPARDVKAFLAGTAVTNPGESRFNPVWAAGLDALFAERYATAVARLTEANQLVRDLPDVKLKLTEAEQKVKNPPPRPFPWAWVSVAVTLASAGVYGGMLGRRWWKNRFRLLPTQVIALMEKGLTPAMLDARSSADYEASPLKLHGAIRLPPEDAVAGRITLDVDRSQPIVVYCTSPGETTSARVAHALRQRGYKNVKILKGGLGGWTNALLPVESKSYLPPIGLEIHKNLTLGDVERRRFALGQVIFAEGDDPHGEAYVIHTGTVEITKRIDGTDKVIREMGEGELLGELGIFRGAPRSTAAVAATDVELLVIRNERLDWLIRNRPQLTREILKRLSDMIVQTDPDR